MGGKWKGLILWYLHENKTLRNGELMRLTPFITQKMLTQQLREMEENNLIVRKVYEQVPQKRITYRWRAVVELFSLETQSAGLNG